MVRFVENGGFWVLGQVVVLSTGFGVPHLLPSYLLPWPVTMFLARMSAATILILAGIFVFTAGWAALGKNLTPMPRPKDDAILVRIGIYRLVRHPLYGGVILIAIGNVLFARSMLGLLCFVLLFAFFDRKATREESWLSERFPEYKAYRQEAKKLIPWVY